MPDILKNILLELISSYDESSASRSLHDVIIGFVSPPPDSEIYAIKLSDDKNPILLMEISEAQLVLQASIEEFAESLSDKDPTKLLAYVHIIGKGTFTEN